VCAYNPCTIKEFQGNIAKCISAIVEETRIKVICLLNMVRVSITLEEEVTFNTLCEYLVPYGKLKAQAKTSLAGCMIL